MRKILTIKQNIDQKEAEFIIDRFSADFVPQVQTKLYYPYYWSLFEYSVKTLFGKKTINVPCIVDLRNKQASTVDDFESEIIEADEESILEGKVEEEKAQELAKSYVIHAVMHKLKSLLYPDVKLLEGKFLFKPIWIIKCQNRSSKSFMVMVDAVTGKFHTLTKKGGV